MVFDLESHVIAITHCLLWCATTTHAVFSLMTGLICIFNLKKQTNKQKNKNKKKELKKLKKREYLENRLKK